MEMEDHERLSSMDSRLERVFRPKKLEPLGDKRRKIRPSFLDLSRRRSSLKQVGDLDGKKHVTKQLLEDMDGQLEHGAAKIGAGNAVADKMEMVGLEQMERWKELMTKESPVKVGRDCMNTCGVEFDECVRFLSSDLKYLHALFGGASPVPRQLAEACLERGELLLQIWRTQRRVLADLLTRCEEDISRYRRESSVVYNREIERELGALKKKYFDLFNERERLLNVVQDYEKFVKDVKKVQDRSLDDNAEEANEETQMEYQPPTFNPSGVTDSLSELHQDLLNLAQKAKFGGKMRHVGGGADSEGHISAKDFPSASTSSGKVKTDDSEGPNNRSKRRSTMIQVNVEKNLNQLDEIQKSEIIASLLASVKRTTVKSVLTNLNAQAHEDVIATLAESLSEGRGMKFVEDLFNKLQSSKDRVDAVAEFVKLLKRDEEIEMLVPLLVGNIIHEALLIRTMRENKTLDLHDQGTQTKPVTLCTAACAGSSTSQPSSQLTNAIELTASKQQLSKQTSKRLLEAIETKLRLTESEMLKAIGEDEQTDDDDANNKNENGSSSEEEHKEELSLAERMGDLILSHVDIKNPHHLANGAGTGALKVTVTLTKVKAKTGYVTQEALPWEKYLGVVPKGLRLRKIDAGNLEQSVIGEVYMRKVLADRSTRGRYGCGTHSLAKVVLLYFTQKYGLKSLAEEYLYGLIHCIRASHETSKRIELFGILVGCIREEAYTPMLCDVVMEILALVYDHDKIAKIFSHGFAKTAVETFKAQKALRTIFPCANNTDTISAGNSQGSLDEDPDAVGMITWVMPENLRSRLLKWVEDVSMPAAEFDKHCNLDHKVLCLDTFLYEVVLTFVDKLVLDRKMLMELFSKFDVNGDGVLSFEEFVNLINECQPSPPMNDADITDLWIQVHDYDDHQADSENITPEGFATVCIRKNIKLPYWKVN